MTTRLLLIAHPGGGSAAEPVFADPRVPAQPDGLPRVGRVTRWFAAPGPAAAVAGWWASDVEIRPGWQDPDLGTWRGRALAEVAQADPAGLQAWLTDPYAAPHGGESLAALTGRLAEALAGDWPEGRCALVVAPLVARAALVAALGVDPAAVFRVDVAPLGTVELSRSGAFWRLRRLAQAERPLQKAM